MAEAFKIILDAGHGKQTPGKRCPDDSMREWDFNSAVAAYAKELLGQYQDVNVQFTHDPTGEVDIPLKKRTDYANAWGANVFVSIHANASSDSWTDAIGIETFTYITKPKEAVELATLVQKKLVASTGRRDRGVKDADFHVLRETHMTSILAECGFMTNKAESNLLKTSFYRQLCAKAIVDALAEHYKFKLKLVAPAKPPAPPKPAAHGYRVQVGYFDNRENAEAVQKQLAEKGFSGVITEV